jgi:prepilin-type N-terminal cleavage/methylation domain-containing protein
VDGLHGAQRDGYLGNGAALELTTIMVNEKGFTLTELLVAMTMSLIILGAARTMYTIQAHTVKAQEKQMEAQEYARVALDIMAREIRNLGYFPKQTPCPGSTKGMVSATASSISFVYDANGDGACTGPGESITYDIVPGPEADTYDIRRTDGVSPPQTLTNGNIIANPGGQPLFTYYSRQPGPACPCSLDTIQRVDIWLTVKLSSTDPKVGGQQNVTMNTSVNLRNRIQ